MEAVLPQKWQKSPPLSTRTAHHNAAAYGCVVSAKLVLCGDSCSLIAVRDVEILSLTYSLPDWICTVLL